MAPSAGSPEHAQIVIGCPVAGCLAARAPVKGRGRPGLPCIAHLVPGLLHRHRLQGGVESGLAPDAREAGLITAELAALIFWRPLRYGRRRSRLG